MTLSPGALDRTAATSASALPITRSSTLVTTTPLGRPAAAAAPPLVTSTILAPSLVLSLATCTPSEACEAVPFWISSSAMRLAWSTGIAKPSPIEPLCACGDIPAHGGDRRVDPDQFAVHVDQRPAGVAGVDRGVGLDGVEHGVLVAGVAAGGDRTVQRADDAGGDGAFEPQRRPDRHDVLAHPQVGRRAEA